MFALLPLFGVWLLAVVSPGPDFLVTAQYATSRSRRHGVLVGLGVSSAILVWAAGSMLGLSVLLARVSLLYDLVRWAGALYLGYLGVRMLWSGRPDAMRRAASRRPAPPARHGAGDGVARDGVARDEAARDGGVGPAGAADPRRGGLGRAWRVGFLTNIGNPKAAAFFGSLLGALLPAHLGVAARIGVVAGMVAVAVVWFGVVALVFGLPPVARAYRRGRRWIDRIMAAVLIALGGRLALER